jgi:two-component system, sensor histidine kinase and response regulator
MAQLFDEAELLDRVDNDWEFLGETVDMLAADGPALLLEIRRALDAHDAAGLGRAAHTLKGMIANFCADVPHAAAFELEKMGKAGDLANASAALVALEERVLALTTGLQALVARGR